MKGSAGRGFLKVFLTLWMLYSFILSIGPLHARVVSPDENYLSLRHSCHFSDCIKACISDMAGFNVNVFSLDTVKVIMATMPIYYGARRLDDPLHRCFYCERCHRNLCDRPRWCKHGCDEGVIALLTGLSLLSFYPYNDELATTARVFLFSIPFTWLAKNALKKIEFHGCERPKNGCFEKKVYYGGFPSGHMTEAIFATTLFGMRFGPKWAIPLGAFSAAIATDFVVSNRHYLSQLVAGSALGVIFGISANKVLNRRFGSGYQWRCSCDVVYKDNKPQLEFGYTF